MGMLKEFKEFALRGNVMDMAIGIIIGAAFSTVVKSLVDDVLMPPIGYLTSGVDVEELSYTMNPPGATEPVEIMYGSFINNVISFLIVALAVFAIVRIMNSLEKKKEVEEKPKELSKQESLLGEIRDLLAKRPTV